jgi:ribosomal protein S18 acetylase RimI-like enzyme
MGEGAAALQKNQEALWALLNSWPGWRVHWEGELIWCQSPTPHEAFNKILRLPSHQEEAKTCLLRLVQQADCRQVPLGLWWEENPRSDSFPQFLATLGFQPIAQGWGMVRPLETTAESPPGPISVHILRGPELWPLWLAVFGQVFELPKPVVEAYGEQMHLGLRGSGPFFHLAAMVQDHLVGTASLFFDQEATAGLYNLAVAPAFRGQGVGQALVQEAMAQAIAAGSRLMVLRSTVEAFPLYLRLGFQPVARYSFFRWARPQPPQPPTP